MSSHFKNLYSDRIDLTSDNPIAIWQGRHAANINAGGQVANVDGTKIRQILRFATRATTLRPRFML